MSQESGVRNEYDAARLVGTGANEEMAPEDEGPSDNSYHSSQAGSVSDKDDGEARANGVNVINGQPRAELMEGGGVDFVSAKEFEKYVESKRDIFDGLTVGGQISLPSYKHCPLSFVKQILANRKKTLRHAEITKVVVPRMKMVTVERVLEIALKDKTLSQYLPDEADLVNGYIDREFLFSLVHTLEPSFFKRAIAEYKAATAANKVEKKEDQVEVSKEMMDILRAFKANSFKGSKKVRPRIAALKYGLQKRKRPVR